MQRRLSNDNVTWTAWESHTASRLWYLKPLNGLKTVYAQFIDGAGNISATIYDQVTLAETYSSLSGQDLWGAYSITVSSTAATSYMSTAAINGNDPIGSSPLAPGSVLVYYTNAGRYGKMEIVGFSPLEFAFLVPHYNVLTFNLSVYNSDGVSLLFQASGLKVDGTYSFDLDSGTQTSIGADFAWQQSTSSVRALIPINGSRFAKWK